MATAAVRATAACTIRWYSSVPTNRYRFSKARESPRAAIHTAGMAMRASA